MRIDEKICFTENLVLQLLAKARSEITFFKLDDSDVSVRFTLGGSSAGQAGKDKKTGVWFVNFNRRLMSDDNNWQDYVDETIIHEVAHIIAFVTKLDRGHGPNWKAIMRKLGAVPSRCHDYDVSAVSRSRRHAVKYIYKCNCSTYSLSRVNHKKEDKKACPLCDTPLNFIKEQK